MQSDAFSWDHANECVYGNEGAEVGRGSAPQKFNLSPDQSPVRLERDRGKGVRVSKIAKFANFAFFFANFFKFLAGSFSAVSKRNFARKFIQT